jgi:tryptophanyl-tRNA synthetase
LGTDGIANMSKSRGNTIDLKDSAETVAKKVRTMYGGPPRGAPEPGKVKANPIFAYPSKRLIATLHECAT